MAIELPPDDSNVFDQGSQYAADNGKILATRSNAENELSHTRLAAFLDRSQNDGEGTLVEFQIMPYRFGGYLSTFVVAFVVHAFAIM
ncbi:hypothetical protein BBP40_011204 [Aspergillus hancockii]|nr:hypothetical protein BBP40_011204 [Aspergillus hancockii]